MYSSHLDNPKPSHSITPLRQTHILFTDCHFSLAKQNHDGRALPLFVCANRKMWRFWGEVVPWRLYFCGSKTCTSQIHLKTGWIHNWHNSSEGGGDAYISSTQPPSLGSLLPSSVEMEKNATKKPEGSQVDARLHWSHKGISWSNKHPVKWGSAHFVQVMPV